MPSRLTCIAILLFWLYAMVGLVTRDLLPELTMGSPPDLRTIAAAGEDSGPARWIIQVVENPNAADGRRPVGQATTESKRGPDGGVVMTSKVVFDSARMLSGLVRGGGSASLLNDEQIVFESTYHVDPSGNLRSFDAQVQVAGQPNDLWKIKGVLNNHAIEVESRGPIILLNKKLSFAYQPRGVVQSQFGPLDRLPGLQVGQRWEEHVANMFTNQVETVRASVERKTSIYWSENPVETLEVVHRSKTASARTWVRPDGLVLRQEVALPLLRLVLERLPDRSTTASPAEGSGR